MAPYKKGGGKDTRFSESVNKRKKSFACIKFIIISWTHAPSFESVVLVVVSL